MLDEASAVPLYRQLADRLLADIRGGHLEPGARLPSEYALAETYRVGRPTVRQATDRLVRKGLLIRRRGAGTFVADAPQVDLFALGGTIASFACKGVQLDTTFVRPPRRSLAPELHDSPLGGRVVFEATRLGRVAGKPVVVEHMQFEAVHFPDFEKLADGQRSISELVTQHYRLEPRGAEQSFAICRLQAPLSEWLEVGPDHPALRVLRTLEFETVGVAVVVDMICLTEDYVFSQRIGA